MDGLAAGRFELRLLQFLLRCEVVHHARQRWQRQRPARAPQATATAAAAAATVAVAAAAAGRTLQPAPRIEERSRRRAITAGGVTVCVSEEGAEEVGGSAAALHTSRLPLFAQRGGGRAHEAAKGGHVRERAHARQHKRGAKRVAVVLSANIE